MRAALIALGAAVGAYGAYLLLDLGWDNLVAAATWLVGGVLLHDGVLGPLLVLAGALVVAGVPGRVRGPVAAGLVVLGTVTMSAIPVLGRFGERPDNATLLDRNYTVGWLIFAGLVVAATAVGTARATRRRTDSGDAVREPHDEIPVRPEEA